jgi:hypothetical protein
MKEAFGERRLDFLLVPIAVLKHQRSGEIEPL